MLARLASDRPDALLVNVAHDRHDQPALGRHGDADIDVLMANQRVLGKRDVHLRHLANGCRRRLVASSE